MSKKFLTCQKIMKFLWSFLTCTRVLQLKFHDIPIRFDGSSQIKEFHKSEGSLMEVQEMKEEEEKRRRI